MSRKDRREQLINSFIIRIFKAKSAGLSKGMALIKAKHFINSGNKKWTDPLEELFETTWSKKVPPEVLHQFQIEEREANGPVVKDSPPSQSSIRVKPNSVGTKESRPSAKPVKIKPGKSFDPSKWGVDSEEDLDKDRYLEDEGFIDLNDPSLSKPLMEYVDKHPTKKCSKCDKPFTRKKASDNWMICPACAKSIDGLLNESNPNYIFASDFLEQQRINKNKILNIKSL
jgi:ribosomal protein L37AE/L43A